MSVDTVNLSCAELFEKFIAYKSLFVDTRTLEKYYPLVPVLQAVYGDKPANQLGKADIGLLVQKLKNSGTAPETNKRKLWYLSAAWEWGIECELVSKNPWKGTAKLVKCTAPEQARPFTAEEIQKIIAGFESFPNYRQLVPFVKFLFGTGCRTGEAIGLRWGDFTPDCKAVNIKSQLARGKRKSTKTGKSRNLRLSAGLSAMLIEMRSPNQNPEQLVFLWNGNPIDAMNFRSRPWIKVLEKVGVEYRKPYNTRHTFISHCLGKGIDPVTVAALCGNSTRVIFAHYAGVLNIPETPEILAL